MKIKRGPQLEGQRFKCWLLKKLQDSVYVDTDEYPNFPGKQEFITNLLSKKMILPATVDDELTQKELERQKEIEEQGYTQALREYKKLQETLEERMIKAERRLKNESKEESRS